MPVLAPKPLDSYKRDAARLLKGARSGDPAALERFTVLDNPPTEPQLKHALAVVAREAGYEAWPALKQARELDVSEVFGRPGLRDSLNPWFATYDEAKAYHVAHGGVLLPYRQHCFVSSLEILPRLGYERDDPDWKEIGHDFVRPGSIEAQSRIMARLARRFARS
ncbi:MAG: hypothetical protein JF615_10695 [Asticcacaulis sp.]|nr:hypothetical protein [Asticcacaulis sp.]